MSDYPASIEVRTRRPLIGPAGQLSEQIWLRNGVSRKDVVLDNAICCALPSNDIAMFTTVHVTRPNQRLRKENIERRGMGLAPKPLRLTPQEACRPHIFAQLRRTPDVMTMGKLAYWSVTGRHAKITRVRGSFNELKLIDTRTGPIVVDETRSGADPFAGVAIRLVPTINPAYALRVAPWQFVFGRDIERFVRWRSGRLDWTEPNLQSIHPSADEVEAFLATPGPFALDVETTYDDALVCDLRTVGVFDITRYTGIVIPWISIDGQRGLAPGFDDPLRPTALDRMRELRSFDDYHYDAEDGRRIIEALRQWATDTRRTVVTQNGGYFDVKVLERWLGLPGWEFKGWLDQILAARANNSELPRDLYTTGTLYSDVPSWKCAEDDRKIARDPRSYEELARYNNLDNGVVAKTAPILFAGVRRREQQHVVELDHKYQAICRELHEIGMRVSEPIRAKFEVALHDKVALQRERMADAVGHSDFNPNSPQQVGRLLFTDWRLPVIKLTETGLPSTDEDVIRAMLVTPGLLDPAKRKFVQALWTYRGAEKALSNVVLKMKRQCDGGIVLDDGIMRSHFNVHSPSTGRISSSGPPTQNWVKWVRAMCTPRDGHVYVMADYDQIELRLLCSVAGVEAYLEVFRAGGDPHAVTASLVYGEKFDREWERYRATGVKSKLFQSLRRFAKTFVFAVLYGGTAMTVYENVATATDDDGNLLFPEMTYAQVRAATNRWMRNAHQIPAWWQTQWDFAEEHGYVLEPVMGRRRDFPAFERNEIINFPIQSAAGIVMEQGLIRLRERLGPPDFVRGTGIVSQMHDAVTVECPESQADEVVQIVTESLEAQYDHIPGVVFTAQAGIAINWAEDEASARFLAKALGLLDDKADEPTVEFMPTTVPGQWAVIGDKGRRDVVMPADSMDQALLRACLVAARGEPLAAA